MTESRATKSVTPLRAILFRPLSSHPPRPQSSLQLRGLGTGRGLPPVDSLKRLSDNVASDPMAKLDIPYSTGTRIRERENFFRMGNQEVIDHPAPPMNRNYGAEWL